MSEKEVNKKIAFEMYQRGKRASQISQILGKSRSTIYRYIQEKYDIVRYAELKSEIKEMLLQGDFKRYINNLSFRDLSLIKRKFGLWGSTKSEKIQAILAYFKSYSILGVYPENLSRAIVKKAFRIKAKETHPDTNKNVDKFGKEFQKVYNAYSQLMQVQAF